MILTQWTHLRRFAPSIRRRNSTWKVCRDFIDSERRILVKIMTSIWRGNFDMDLTFKIDKISLSFLRELFYVVSPSNRRSFCTLCFHSIFSYYFLFWQPILSESGKVLGWCNCNDIDVITDIGTIGNISFENFATTQKIMSKDNFYFLQSFRLRQRL